MGWRSRNTAQERMDALYPGVPTWLEAPLLEWLASVFVGLANVDYRAFTGQLALPTIQKYELAVRRTSSLAPECLAGDLEGMRQAMDDDEWLDFIDFVLYGMANKWHQSQLLHALESILEEGGSEWTVGERDGAPSLVKRVPVGVAEAAKHAIDSSATAGNLLSEAWHAIFGRNPDAEEAYEKAIKAVEEAGASVVSPKNGRATLGTIVKDMRAQGDWTLPLVTDSADVPIKMAEALWAGQESRHGGNGYRKPTHAEAESAVLLAVPLVQWFTSGVIARSA